MLCSSLLLLLAVLAMELITVTMGPASAHFVPLLSLLARLLLLPLPQPSQKYLSVLLYNQIIYLWPSNNIFQFLIFSSFPQECRMTMACSITANPDSTMQHG